MFHGLRGTFTFYPYLTCRLSHLIDRLHCSECRFAKASNHIKALESKNTALESKSILLENKTITLGSEITVLESRFALMVNQFACLLNTEKWMLNERDKIDAENCNSLLRIEIERLKKNLEARVENPSREGAHASSRPVKKRRQEMISIDRDVSIIEDGDEACSR